MSDTSSTRLPTDVASIARSAREAFRKLALLSNRTRTDTLLAIAEALEGNAELILAANAKDCSATEKLVSNGEMTQALFSRLRIKESGIREMAARVREVANLPDPIGKHLAVTELDNGLILHKDSCPLGVIAVVFESRPDVLPQVASLALKSGNAVLLKGGAEAANSNETIVAIWKETLRRFPDVPQESIELLQSRSDVMELLRLENEVDLLIPRGSKEFVAFMEKNSRIPVLGHGEGICHVFVDRASDVNKAVSITLDSKVQYPAACNSAETLLVHKEIAAAFLPKIVAELKKAKVEVRGCPRVLALLPDAALLPATEKDWSTEYSDLILSGGIELLHGVVLEVPVGRDVECLVDEFLVVRRELRALEAAADVDAVVGVEVLGGIPHVADGLGHLVQRVPQARDVELLVSVLDERLGPCGHRLVERRLTRSRRSARSRPVRRAARCRRRSSSAGRPSWSASRR